MYSAPSLVRTLKKKELPFFYILKLSQEIIATIYNHFWQKRRKQTTFHLKLCLSMCFCEAFCRNCDKQPLCFCVISSKNNSLVLRPQSWPL